MSRTAWIIGGGSGIGAAVARRLAREGWRVAISGRRRERLDEVAASQAGIEAFPLDVTDTAAVTAMVATLARHYGRIDLTIFGAAGWEPGRAGDYRFEPFARLVDTNFLGLVRLLDPLVAQLDAQGGGQIAGIASLAGYFGLPRAAAYASGKAAMISLLETLRTELAPRGIVVRMIAPGFVKSELTAKNDFPMPFLMETDAAAERIVRGLLRSDRFEIAFPRRLAWTMKVIRMLPYPLFFAVTRNMMSKR